ncbi:RNA polymerase sigma factor [bacterium]|nr:RNA polymerase sigma factor [candidate division CSSED10-310 bacterium]
MKDDWELATSSSKKEQFELYKKYNHIVMQDAFKIIADFDICEDISQESWEKAFRKAPFTRRNKEFIAWLRRITLNTAIDFRRKHKNHLKKISCYENEWQSHNSALSESFEGYVVSQEIKVAVERFLYGKSKVLDSKEREVLEMFYVIGERNYQNISKKLGYPENSVRVYKSNGERKLLELLEKEGLL